MRLAGAERTAFGALSGGQQQRVSVALALLGRPEVVVLDELTAGLDPAARRGVWQLVREVNRGGTTVVLVSHQVDEVAHLCDRVALLAQGRVRATGTPDELTAAGADDGAGHSLTFRPLPPVDHAVLEALPAVRSVRRDGDRWTVPGTATGGAGPLTPGTARGSPRSREGSWTTGAAVRGAVRACCPPPGGRPTRPRHSPAP